MLEDSEGHELHVGDFVKMEWQVARVFPGVDIVMLARQGGHGLSSVSPQVVSMRLGTGKGALKTLPKGAPLEEGTRCLSLWRIAQVYPETSSVLVRREGLGGAPERPVAATFTAGAMAAELEYVPPEDVLPFTPPILRTTASGRTTFEFEERSVEIEAEMLPYAFNPGTWADEPEARSRRKEHPHAKEDSDGPVRRLEQGQAKGQEVAKRK